MLTRRSRSRKIKAKVNDVGQTPSTERFQTCLETSKERKSTEQDFEVVSKAVQNVLVLEKITSFLSLSDLKSFRLVSRQWNQESLSVIRKRVASLLLTDNKRMNKLIQRCLKREKIWNKKIETQFTKYLHGGIFVTHCRKLLKLIKSSNAGFPCTKFGFTTKLLENFHGLFYDFLKTVSSFATELELIVDHKDVSIDMGRLKFPFLRALKMSQNYKYCNFEESFKCFKHVINNAPLLDDIHATLATNNIFGRKTLSDTFLKAIKASEICGQIRAFAFEGQMDDEFVVTLNEMRWKLKNLNLAFHSGDQASQENIVLFLESQYESLKELTIQNQARGYIVNPGRNDKCSLASSFPCMRKVTVLNLRPSVRFFSQVSLSRDFPVLKRLVFKDNTEFLYCNEITSMLNRTLESVDTVTDLVLPVTLGEFRVINQAARIFPRLTKLDVFCPYHFRQELGNGLENLQELMLRVIDNTTMLTAFTKLMTGHSAEELKVICETWKQNGELEVEINKQPHEFLQKLKVLQIHGGQLHDVFCLLGPLRFRSLQRLDLRQSKDSKITQPVLVQMREKFEVLIDNDNVIQTKKMRHKNPIRF